MLSRYLDMCAVVFVDVCAENTISHHPVRESNRTVREPTHATLTVKLCATIDSHTPPFSTVWFNFRPTNHRTIPTACVL